MCTITPQRWASISAFLSFSALTVTITLLALYAKEEIRISVTHDTGEGPGGKRQNPVNTATVTILFSVFTMIGYVYVLVGSLIYIKTSSQENVFMCCHSYYGGEMWCYIVYFIPKLILFIIAFSLNTKDFGILPTTPLQCIVFFYMVLIIVMTVGYMLPICIRPWLPTEEEKKAKVAREVEQERLKKQQDAEKATRKAQAQQEAQRESERIRQERIDRQEIERLRVAQAKWIATDLEAQRQVMRVDNSASVQLSVIPSPSFLTSRSLASPSRDLEAQ